MEGDTSDNREQFIEDGEVDLVRRDVLHHRRAQAADHVRRPLLRRRPELMVKSDNDTITAPTTSSDPDGKVCSVTGSTPSENIKEYLASPDQLVLLRRLRQVRRTPCGTDQVEVVTTDNVILAGYVGESDGEFKLVGEQFTEEPIRHRDHEGRRGVLRVHQRTRSPRTRTRTSPPGRRPPARSRAPRPRRCPSPTPASDPIRHRSRCRSARYRGRLTREGARWRPSPTTWISTGPDSCAPWASACGRWCGSLVLGTVIAAFRVSPRPGTSRLRHCVGDRDPQLPADRGAVLHRVRAPRDRGQRRLRHLRRDVRWSSTPPPSSARRSGPASTRSPPGRLRPPGPSASPSPSRWARSCCPRRSAARCPRWGA